MDVLSAVQAGHYLGVAEKTVRNMINRGELEALSLDPVRLDSRHVDGVLRMRQTDARHDLARTRQTPVSLARETRLSLRPPRENKPLPDRVADQQRLKLALVSDRAKLLFGTAALNAALLDDGSCRWCAATRFATVLKTWAPEQYGDAFRELFDQVPCEVCGPALYGPVLASLKARVHGGGRRSSEAVPRPSAAERQAAQEYVQQRAVTAAARPVGDGDARDLVGRRRREVQAGLTAARRRGDTRHALELQQQLRTLTADASRVDGKAARPGRLACGHALSFGCGCPRPSSRGRS